MKIIMWNIRDMGKKARLRQLKEMLAKEKPDIIGLQEMIKRHFDERELKALAPGGKFKWGWLAASGHSGGILLGVKEEVLEVEDWDSGDYYMGAQIRHRTTNIRWICLTVYGPAQHDRSGEFLEELGTKCKGSILPILIGGDFNLIRSEEDKNLGIGNQRWITAFNSFIETLDLREIYRGGGGYTWSNKQARPILCNLDRILVSTDWEEKFPLANLRSLTRLGSDHSPLLLDTGGEMPRGQPQFRFERHWFEEEGLLELIETKWSQQRAKWSRETYSMDKWHNGISDLRKHLKGRGANLRGHYKREKDRLTKEIEDIDRGCNKGERQAALLSRRLELESELERLMEKEEIYWQQRGGEKWVLEGDANTNFFHLVANGRRRRKAITRLEHEGREITDREGIQNVICNYYKQLFGKQTEKKVTMGVNTWGRSGRLTEEDNMLLTRPFTEEEIKEAVFSMKENSAPGPDGFGVIFYKRCWGVIKGELIDMISDFYLERLDIGRLNYGVVTLIPKVQNAENVKQYRPICLLNVSFKIFTKLIADRMSVVAQKIIDPCQTAFIKGRYILDGAVMLHEIVHELRVRKKKGVILKLDFEKAYDNVRWGFVEEVMIRKGFSDKLRGWIMSTIRGGRVCVNINGDNSPYFKTHRGLRQGDPLSPLMFNLAVDALAHIMNKAKEKGHIKGVNPHLVDGGITHLQYADDTIIMMEGDDDSIKNTKFVLYCFEWMSGLKINYHKGEVVTFGYDNRAQLEIAKALNCKVGKLPMTYLGLPISDKHLGAAAFNPVVDKMRMKLQPWKGKNITSGGRLTLTNSSLSSLPIYTMGIYLLQEGVHKQMDTIGSQFFWRGDCNKFKYHMVKWDHVCLPKDFGGLGILNT